MSQRNSGYARIAQDTYVTPQWVWDQLHYVEPWTKKAWDCCPENADFDILTRTDTPRLIASNTPYGSLGPKIVRHILSLDHVDKAAFLFPTDWDCAKGRKDLFDSHGPFKCKYILTRRILWDNLEHTAQPSANHAWFVFDKHYIGAGRLHVL